ncbi:MAG: radical SAM protein [Caldilineaceae bacterium]
MKSTVEQLPRLASGALTSTGGFLDGFTHTLQPYIGCQFACEYCYVKGLAVHRFHHPPLPWGKYVHPRTGIDHRLRVELRRMAQRNRLDALSIFMSSATDPYQIAERRHRLTRACLDVMIETPPGLLVVQTRSPFVTDDFVRLRELKERCWLNLTLETDLDDVRRRLTPFTPSIRQRLHTLEAALAYGLNVQITVSPCLPFSNVESFGKLLVSHSHRVIVDTYCSGDGMKGRRTQQTAIPALYTQLGLGEWRSEEAAMTLFHWLRSRIGEKVGWSQEGFLALTK